MAKVEHFEIPADDVERASAFYLDVLGFTYEQWDDDNGMITTTEGGINGDIHRRGPVPHPTVVFTVDRIEDTVAKAVERGGEQVGEIQPMGETARWVYIRDSEGNLIGPYDDQGAAS